MRFFFNYRFKYNQNHQATLLPAKKTSGFGIALERGYSLQIRYRNMANC